MYTSSNYNDLSDTEIAQANSMMLGRILGEILQGPSKYGLRDNSSPALVIERARNEAIEAGRPVLSSILAAEYVDYGGIVTTVEAFLYEYAEVRANGPLYVKESDEVIVLGGI